MEKYNMKEQIRESLGEYTPDVLSKIKDSSEFFVPAKEKDSFFQYFTFKRLSYSLASVFVLALLVTILISSPSSVPVVASTITIDINPSIQITLDDEDNVINVIAINDDGDELINKDVSYYRGLSLDEAIETIIERANELELIVSNIEENIILISVDSKNAQLKARIEAQVETKISAEVHRYAQHVRVIKESNDDLTDEQIDNLKRIANQHRITVAKLALINRIIALDESYTVLDLKDMSIRELDTILTELIIPNGPPGFSN